MHAPAPVPPRTPSAREAGGIIYGPCRLLGLIGFHAGVADDLAEQREVRFHQRGELFGRAADGLEPDAEKFGFDILSDQNAYHFLI
jgi:hypothetical protein